ERGKEAKTVFEYEFLTGLQQATSLPDVISNSVQYMELFNEAMTNRGAAPAFSQERIDAYRNDPTLPNQNWFDLVYRTAPMQQHNFKLHGGKEDLRFYFSGGYLDQEGIEIENSTE